MNRSRYVALAVVFLIGLALVRILFTYKITAQAFDEPCHVAAAMEFLDKGTYTLDPVHPPLARVAIGIPLYLAGARFPNWPANDPRIRNYNDVGNDILNHGGMYLRNLSWRVSGYFHSLRWLRSWCFFGPVMSSEILPP